MMQAGTDAVISGEDSAGATSEHRVRIIYIDPEGARALVDDGSDRWWTPIATLAAVH